MTNAQLFLNSILPKHESLSEQTKQQQKKIKKWTKQISVKKSHKKQNTLIKFKSKSEKDNI
jgi:hypothetical protein